VGDKFLIRNMMSIGSIRAPGESTREAYYLLAEFGFESKRFLEYIEKDGCYQKELGDYLESRFSKND
jgi:hypothetical protein